MEWKALLCRRVGGTTGKDEEAVGAVKVRVRKEYEHLWNFFLFSQLLMYTQDIHHTKIFYGQEKPEFNDIMKCEQSQN